MKSFECENDLDYCCDVPYCGCRCHKEDKK